MSRYYIEPAAPTADYIGAWCESYDDCMRWLVAENLLTGAVSGPEGLVLISRAPVRQNKSHERACNRCGYPADETHGHCWHCGAELPDNIAAA